MFARINSMGLFGMDSYMVQVEADLSQGLPRFDIVGLPDAAISEAKNRVRSAIKNTGFAFPVSRITVNLAPAGRKKEGTLYDLPILLGILASAEEIKPPAKDAAFVGELSLTGTLRAVNGVLPMAMAAVRAGIRTLYVPAANAAEATLADGVTVYGVPDVVSVLGVGNIHTKRFEYGQRLVGSRSPHISMSNVWVPTNVECSEIDRYFNLTNEIVCINSIGENVLNELSGCDR